jgi:hypothetical protein
MLRHGKKAVDTIFIHCSATRPDWMADAPVEQKAKEIGRWHREKGWGLIGYHWVIDRNGVITKGRDENIPGAHVAGHNTGSIGICLIGGHGSSENDHFRDNYTAEQEMALLNLIEDIKTRADIKFVRGHNEVSAKACPGFNVQRWLAKKPPQPKLTESTTVRATAVQMVSGAGAAVTAIGALDGKAQIVIVLLAAVGIAAAAWVMRERIRKWAREVAQ